ncbi:hypothetical protein D9M69_633040 [compost metagenome]
MRQPHLASGALEQPGAQPRLHPLDQVGHRGTGNLQILGGLGKAVPLGDAHEHPHFLETVHGVSSIIN